MILFIFATHAEAVSTLALLEGKMVHENLYACKEGWIAISGIGIHAAQQTVSRYASAVDEIWNLGIAGSLHPSEMLGTLYPIATIDKYVPSLPELDSLSQHFVEATLPRFFTHQLGLKLISSDFPIHSPDYRKQLALQADLVDMEGYGIAYAAHHLKKPFHIWKIVSDFASHQGRELIRSHLHQFSANLAEKIAQELRGYHESCCH